MRPFIGGMVALLATMAIGCGGGGDTTTEVALTKVQFIKRGDAICQAAQKKKGKALAAWLKDHEQPKNGEERVTAETLGQVYLDLGLPPIKEATAELAELTPPAGDTKAKELVKSLNAAVEAIEEKPTSVVRGTPYANADQLAAEYGFQHCRYF